MSAAPVLLRAEAGAEVGFGHLMRCIALAEGLQSRRMTPVLVVTDSPHRALTLPEACRDFQVERVTPESLAADAVMTTSLMRQEGATTVITDVCTKPALDRAGELDAFHAALKHEAAFLMVVAAGYHLDPVADVVVNPYLLPRPADARLPRVLWGPEYFIFRPEFIRAAVTPRIIAAEASRVLVAVGGSDPARLTPRIIDAVANAGVPNLVVRVVIGPGMSADERADIAARVAADPGVWHLVEQPDDMAAQLLWADAAITGDGLTKYETAVTGTPSVIVARPNSDPALNAAFATGGSTLVVAPDAQGHWPDLLPAVARLLRDRVVRESMSKCGRALVDGRGRERVLDLLPKVSAA